MDEKLQELLGLVDSEESFVRFIEGLSQDWYDAERKEAESPSSPYGRGHNGWENGTIGGFLESASAWAQAPKNGAELYKKPENLWRRAAEIIYMGKIYE
ncbi:hypothetical protein H8K33_11710 [Undibacterium amnicola]|uniref:DUF7660 domain-containing protein n=1 Tax=Undibacterium amnicola TaxID=1834038 RepID=A0ABR6XRS6_9BURK|nr:hypothetical protein [Undibacterium amnicola]MBC3832180.1 hypothetical protein [Undibacterium amnicola]